MKISKTLFLFSLSVLALVGTASAQGLSVTKVKDKFGYADASGNVVIKANYTTAYPFENGKAKVQKDNKWGYIGTDGKPIIKIEYDNIEEFVNGIALVKKGDKYGYIKENGTFYIKPEWSFIGSINEDGYVWVAKGKTLSEAFKGLYRYDKLIIPAKYNSLGFYVVTDSADYTSGEAIIHINGLPRNNEIRENFAKLSCSKEPYIWATFGVLSNIFDLEGKPLLKNIKGAAGMPQDGYVLVRKYSKKGEKEYHDYNYYAVNANGKKLFKKDVRQLVDPEDVYESCGPFRSGRAMCGTEKEAFLIDNMTNLKSAIYSRLNPVANGQFICISDNRMGIISPEGTEVVAPTYRSIVPVTADASVYAAKNNNHRSGFIGADGSTIIPFRYDETYAFVGGKGYVKQGQYCGIIDSEGNFIVKNRWEDILPAAAENDDLVWVKSPATQKWSVLQISTDKQPFEILADDCSAFDDKGRAIYQKDGHVGAIASDGSSVLPLYFDSVSTALRALNYIDLNGEANMNEINAYRFNIHNSPDLHKFRLHQNISSNMWDY